MPILCQNYSQPLGELSRKIRLNKPRYVIDELITSKQLRSLESDIRSNKMPIEWNKCKKSVCFFNVNRKEENETNQICAVYF